MSTRHLEFCDRYARFQSRKGCVEFRVKAHLLENILSTVKDDMADPSVVRNGEGGVRWYISLGSPETRSVTSKSESPS